MHEIEEAARGQRAAGGRAPDGAISTHYYTTARHQRQPLSRGLIKVIRDAIDFSALVEETTGPLPCRPRGRAVLVHCPYHADVKTPSLGVYDDHATCYGACHETWDVFGWLMKRDNLTFPQARDELARRANIPKPHWTFEQEQAAREQREYEDVLSLVARHFASHLQETPAALAYAHDRAWSDEVIRTERVGYADGGPLPDLGNEQAQKAIEALNRWGAKIGGAIIYVHRDGGRVVYLAGRSIEGKAHYNPPTDLAGPKRPYLNAPYSARAEEVIVVEGQADAVTLSGWGISALALTGSGLTGDLAARLERHVERGAVVYVVPDGDGRTDVAGLAAAVGPLLHVVELPEGVADVNAWAQDGATAEGFRERLDAASTWLALEIERVAKINGWERVNARRVLFERLAELDDFSLTDYYREQVIKALGISVSDFNRYLKTVRGEAVVERRNGGSDERYIVEDGRQCVVKYGRNGEQYAYPLCNFTAQVVEDVALDDGVEIERKFTVTGRLENGKPLSSVQVDASKFTMMGWISDEWGIRAVVRAGWRNRDQLREAIQLRSTEAERRHVYTHTGWRQIDEKRVYLHTGGALGLEDVDVELGRELGRYALHSQAQDVTEAMRASLRFLDIAPDTVTVPLWAAAYLAPLTEIMSLDSVLWIYGVTGALKSTLAALMLCHYGEFTWDDLPASWTSTAYSLEMTCFQAKDSLLVIDDFAPQSDPYQARKMERNADYIVRSVGNRSGRGRLTSNLVQRIVHPPRGLVVSTGEQILDGQSTTARMYAVEMHPGDVDLERLSAAQAEAGRYSHALTGYLLWVAGQWDYLSQYLPQKQLEERKKLLAELEGSHLRIPDVLATLYLGLDLGLAYAVEVGALTEAGAQELRDRGWKALKTGAEAQARSIEQEKPTVLFLEVLDNLLAQGRVWLEAKDGEGKVGGAVGAELLGWYDDDYVYILAGAAYNRVARFLRDEGRHFPVKKRTLRKHLADEGYLMRGQDGRYTDAVLIDNKTQRVLRIHRDKVETYINYPVVKSGNNGNNGNESDDVPF